VVEIRPFKGIEFDASKSELAKSVAPPFDVLNEEAQERLRKHPYNIVHVTLPKKGKDKDAYERASKLLDEWLAAGVLKETAEDAVYAYEIWYRLRHQERRMRGVLVALKVDPTYKQVLPHERIFDKPAEDRLKLLRATGVDLEPIWLLYSGKSAEETLWAYIDGAGSNPDLLVTGPDGTIHKLWRIVDPAVVGTVVEGLKGRKAYIADGHHRYATAVKYAEERRLREYRPSKTAEYEFKMVLLVNMSDPGLTIQPTHRVVKAPKKIDPEELRKKLAADFIIEDHRLKTTKIGDEIVALLEAQGALAGAGPRFAIYLGGPTFSILRSRESVLSEEAAPGRSFTWRSLDVAFLQKLIIEKAVGVPETRWGDDVYYTRDENEAAQLVKTGKAALAAFHLSTKLPQLRAIADAAEHMPQKSTYFAPKALSGLVLHKIGKPGPVEERKRITS
jgi:uncharacterized protein (DUF1015 family)